MELGSGWVRVPHVPLCPVAVELPSADAGMEVGAGSVLRQHHRREAGRADAPHRPLPRLSDQRGEMSERKIFCVLDNMPTPREQAAGARSITASGKGMTPVSLGKSPVLLSLLPVVTDP